MTSPATPPRSVIIAFSLLAALIVGWSIFWFAFRAKLQGDVAEFRLALSEAGLQLTCADETWAGFPFRYELTCASVQLKGSSESQPLAASATQLRLVMQTYNPFHIIALLDGPTTVNGKTITHETGRGSLQYTLAGDWDAAAELPKPSEPEFGDAAIVKLFARVKDGRLQLAANADQLKSKRPDVPEINHAEITAATDAALLEAEDPLRQAIRSATPLDITALKLETGKVSITGTGSFVIDAGRRIDGKLQNEVNDIDSLLRVLAPQLKLSEEQVAGAKTVIGLIGGNKPGAPVKLDIIAKQGELYFGPFKIADIPPLP